MTSLLKTLAITVAVGMIAWAADPFVGTWKSNPEKSKLMAGQRLELGSIVCEAAEGGYRFSSSDATPIVYRLDGKIYPTSGTARFAKGLGADEWSSRRLSANAIEANYFRAKKPVGTIRREVTSDGRTFTSTHDGVRPSGEKVAFVHVFDKQ
jgi:hypothetical protein